MLVKSWCASSPVRGEKENSRNLHYVDAVESVVHFLFSHFSAWWVCFNLFSKVFHTLVAVVYGNVAIVAKR